MRRRTAFTLIEILVVIAIISLLAAILLPALTTARGRAQQTRCAVQLREIGLAIRMYADDHDGLPPEGGYDVAPPSSGQPVAAAALRVSWQDSLLQSDYLNDVRVLACPAETPPQAYYPYRCSYGSNRWVMGWYGAVNLDTLRFPSRTVLITEKTGCDWPAWEPGTQINNPYYFPLDYRHPGGLNVLYCDGHVAAVSSAAMQQDPYILWNWH